VREDITRSVRIVDRERQRPCPLGDVVQRSGSETPSPSGVVVGDGLGVVERVGLESELGHQQAN
jgi:hypothetical protein